MADTASSSPIKAIPLEVLLRISYYLTTPELGNLRLACRSIEQSLYTTLVHEFFTRKQFMMTEHSLQALIDISRSRLSDHLRFVHIGLERYPQSDMQHRLTSEDREARFAQGSADQFALWSSGHHREMLADAFANLKNLEDVVIRDFNNKGRHRDGYGTEWTSYGLTTVKNETGIRLSHGDDLHFHADPSARWCSQVFSAVLAALGQAGARPKGIEVMARHRNYLRDFAFNVPSFLEPSVVPVLLGLEKLHVDIDTSWRSINLGSTFPSALQDPMVRRFLLHCINLKHLRINERHSQDKGIGPLLQWLGEDSAALPPTTTFPTPVPSPAFNQLTELNLGQMIVQIPWILAIVRKFAPTLRSLELWKLNIMRRLPDNHRGTPPRLNFWAKFLEKLSKGVPGLELRHIKLGALTQQWDGRTIRSQVTFREGKTMIVYTGPDWKHFIEENIPAMDVLNPDNSSFGEDDEDNDDDDDDDGIWDLYALDL
ncbi:hypothetical protein G7046_g976 [Stylonectria norvegica]|nr:hypothetical protein G7046_g976 [Stylonectria norvegica]